VSDAAIDFYPCRAGKYDTRELLLRSVHRAAIGVEIITAFNAGGTFSERLVLTVDGLLKPIHRLGFLIRREEIFRELKLAPGQDVHVIACANVRYQRLQNFQ
jgi:hypothetical protein